tara:strand:- start:493 stop:1524 length:1032 start_codon:yes stop_codon:yes gene_type:complete
MSKPGGLADCSYPGWYEFEGNDWKNHVGYINDCENNKCSSTHEFVGLMDHWKSHINTGIAHTQTNGNDCKQTKGQICGLAWNDFGVCQKKLDNYSNDWINCCKNNEKYSPKNNCFPYWYKDNGIYSNQCRDICMGKPYLNNRKVNNSETLKNNFSGKLCHDILKTNNNQSDLREFCSKAPAWDNDNGPNKDYTDICGCFYPDSYYNNLKKIISEKTKIPENMLGDKRCFSSLCSNSDMTNTNCPDLNILTCINNVNFKGNVNNTSNININQTNDCKQKYSEMKKGVLPDSSGLSDSQELLKNATFVEKIKIYSQTNKSTFIIIIVILFLLLLLLIIGIIVAIK